MFACTKCSSLNFNLFAATSFNFSVTQLAVSRTTIIVSRLYLLNFVNFRIVDRHCPEHSDNGISNIDFVFWWVFNIAFKRCVSAQSRWFLAWWYCFVLQWLLRWHRPCRSSSRIKAFRNSRATHSSQIKDSKGNSNSQINRFQIKISKGRDFWIRAFQDKDSPIRGFNNSQIKVIFSH